MHELMTAPNFRVVDPRFFQEVLRQSIFEEYKRLAKDEVLPNLYWTNYEERFLSTEDLLIKNLGYRMASDPNTGYPDDYALFNDRHFEQLTDDYETMDTVCRVKYVQEFLDDLHHIFTTYQLTHVIAEPLFDPRASYYIQSSKGGFSCTH